MGRLQFLIVVIMVSMNKTPGNCQTTKNNECIAGVPGIPGTPGINGQHGPPCRDGKDGLPGPKSDPGKWYYRIIRVMKVMWSLVDCYFVICGNKTEAFPQGIQ